MANESQPISIEISKDGSTWYPCCFLPREVCAGPDFREAYIDVGDGHKPAVARLFMAGSVFKEMWPSGPTSTTKYMVRIGAYGEDWTPGASPAWAYRSNTTRHCFYLATAKVIFQGKTDVIYELILVTFQYSWTLSEQNPRIYNELDRFNRQMMYGGLPVLTLDEIIKDYLTTCGDTSDEAAWNNIISPKYIGTAPTFPSLGVTLSYLNPFNLYMSGCIASNMRKILEPAACRLTQDIWTGGGVADVNQPILDIERVLSNSTYLGHLQTLFDFCGYGGYHPDFPNYEILPAKLASNNVYYPDVSTGENILLPGMKSSPHNVLSPAATNRAITRISNTNASHCEPGLNQAYGVLKNQSNPGVAASPTSNFLYDYTGSTATAGNDTGVGALDSYKKSLHFGRSQMQCHEFIFIGHTLVGELFWKCIRRVKMTFDTSSIAGEGGAFTHVWVHPFFEGENGYAMQYQGNPMNKFTLAPPDPPVVGKTVRRTSFSGGLEQNVMDVGHIPYTTLLRVEGLKANGGHYTCYPLMGNVPNQGTNKGTYDLLTADAQATPLWGVSGTNSAGEFINLEEYYIGGSTNQLVNGFALATLIGCAKDPNNVNRNIPLYAGIPMGYNTGLTGEAYRSSDAINTDVWYQFQTGYWEISLEVIDAYNSDANTIATKVIIFKGDTAGRLTQISEAGGTRSYTIP